MLLVVLRTSTYELLSYLFLTHFVPHSFSSHSFTFSNSIYSGSRLNHFNYRNISKSIRVKITP